LPPDWQAVAVPVTPVAANLSKALDVEADLFLEFTFDPILPVNVLSEPVDLLLGKVICLGLGIYTGIIQNLMA